MKLSEAVVSIILNTKSSHQPVIIGIDGFGGSGKTTIAEQLATSLDSTFIVHLDDFIDRDKILEDSWDKGGFDRERLRIQVLEPLKKGEAARFQKLVWRTNQLGAFQTIPAVDYVVIEGTSIGHPDTAGLLDLLIWVDCNPKTAKQRGKQRDTGTGNEQYWDLWATNDQLYANKYQPAERADITIAN